MAEKKDTDATLGAYKSKSSIENKSIVVPQKVVSVDLTSTEKQRTPSSHLIKAVMILSLLLVHIILLIVTCLLLPHVCQVCLPSGNPVEQVHSLTYRAMFRDHITGDIYKYGYDSKLFASKNDKTYNISF